MKDQKFMKMLNVLLGVQYGLSQIKNCETDKYVRQINHFITETIEDYFEDKVAFYKELESEKNKIEDLSTGYRTELDRMISMNSDLRKEIKILKDNLSTHKERCHEDEETYAKERTAKDQSNESKDDGIRKEENAS